MQAPVDVDTGVGQQRQRQRPGEIHDDGHRRREHEQERPVAQAPHEQGRKEKAKKVNSALATAGGAAAGFALKNRIATIVYRHEINPSESLRKAFEYAAKRK